MHVELATTGCFYLHLQAAIDPVKVLADGTTAPLSTDEASARVPLPSAQVRTLAVWSTTIGRTISSCTLNADVASRHLTIQLKPPRCVQDNMRGNAGATTTGDYISDVVDWKVGAASLAVAIILWFIFA